MTNPSPLMFDRSFDAKAGEVVDMPGCAVPVRRITANNPGAMTFTGTNSYLVGKSHLAVIDPGPEDEAHLAALITAIGNARVEAICITHTHRDHSPLARRLQALTSAPIVGADTHRFARPFKADDAPVDQAVDEHHVPDQALNDGEEVAIGDIKLEAIATPGHTMNHLCFAVAGENILFSGDHVMGWATSLVAPPDGAMAPYLESLEKLLARTETRYLPGHGSSLKNAKSFVEALLAHRLGRDTSILAALEQAPRAISQLVDSLYEGLDKRLHRAAGLSILAHLERLETLGEVTPITDQDGLWAKVEG